MPGIAGLFGSAHRVHYAQATPTESLNMTKPQIVDLYGRPVTVRPIPMGPRPVSERPAAPAPAQEARPSARVVRKPSSGMFAKQDAPASLPPPAKLPVPEPTPLTAGERLKGAPMGSGPLAPETRAPGPRLAPVAVVYVRGRRVAWSRSPDWSPLRPAVGTMYDMARLSGLAGVTKSGVVDVVRDLLEHGPVVVHSDVSDRIVHVSKPEDGGSIRAAWSETSVWSPFEDARSSAGRAAREIGAAGVEVGLEGLRKALRGI